MDKQTLTLNLKGEYFDAIKGGSKLLEYRLMNDYWKKRLVGRDYENIVICRGYPKRGDTSKRLTFKYCGYTETTITHKHFGTEPVDVFAIIIGDNNG